MVDKNSETNIIINDDLVSIVLRATITQNYYSNNKARNKLSNANGEACKVQDIVSDIYLLNAIYQEMFNLNYLSSSTRNRLFEKKQTSRDLINDTIKGLKEKKGSLIDNMNKELSGLPLMNREYYRICINKNTSNMDILHHEYGINIPKYVVPNGNYDLAARNVIQMNSIKMITTKQNPSVGAYIVADGTYIEKNNQTKPQYKHLNIVEAGLFVHEKNVSKELESLMKSLRKPTKDSSEYKDIYEQYKKLSQIEIDNFKKKLKYYQTLYPKEEFTLLKNILIKLEQTIEQYYSYKKSIEMFDRIANILNYNLNSGQKFQLIDKITKEKKLFEDELKKLQENLSILNEKFKEECTRMENSKNNERKPISKSQKQGPKENIEVKESSIETPTKPLLKFTFSQKEIMQVSSKEQKKLYNRYKIYRDTLDEIFERKNQYSSEEYFQNDVVNVFYGKGIGTNYEEIIKNIHDMRRQLEVTNIIQKNIEDVRMEFESIEEMYKEDSNGLTNFENRVIGRLISLSTNNEISEELKAEISYYVKKYQKLISEISFIVQNKNGYPKEIYDQLITNMKMLNYINTNLLDEVGLTKEAYKSKK